MNSFSRMLLYADAVVYIRQVATWFCSVLSELRPRELLVALKSSTLRPFFGHPEFLSDVNKEQTS